MLETLALLKPKSPIDILGELIVQPSKFCSIVLALILLEGCGYSNQFIENGFRYSVPAHYYSVKLKLSQAEAELSESSDLQQMLEFAKKNNHTVVDILVRDDKGGGHRDAIVTIIFEPIAEYDPLSFSSDVFRAMSAMSDSVNSDVLPKISLVDPKYSFGFYRMNVSDAYGVLGLSACFLFRATDGGQIQVTIITDEDPYADHFQQILRGIKSVNRSTETGKY
jgi:hypothetical protein